MKTAEEWVNHFLVNAPMDVEARISAIQNDARHSALTEAKAEILNRSGIDGKFSGHIGMGFNMGLNTAIEAILALRDKK